MRFLTFFKKQNLAIKIGFVSLAITVVALLLALILISTSNFVAKNRDSVSDTSLIGNGWSIISRFGVHALLTKDGYDDMYTQYNITNDFVTAPITQVISGLVFLIIVLPIFGGIAILALISGYFKKWLYT